MRNIVALIVVAASVGCSGKPAVETLAPAPATAQEVAELRQQVSSIAQSVQQNTAAQNAIAIELRNAVVELRTAITARPAEPVAVSAVPSAPVAVPAPPRIPESLFTSEERAMRDKISAALRSKQKLTLSQAKFACGFGRRWFDSDIARFPDAFIVEHYDWLVEAGFSANDVLELQQRYDPIQINAIVGGIRSNIPGQPLAEQRFETVRSDPILLAFYLKHATRR